MATAIVTRPIAIIDAEKNLGSFECLLRTVNGKKYISLFSRLYAINHSDQFDLLSPIGGGEVWKICRIPALIN